MDLYSPFSSICSLKLLLSPSESFGVLCHCEKVVFICVPVKIDVIVLLLLAKLVVDFCLESV